MRLRESLSISRIHSCSEGDKCSISLSWSKNTRTAARNLAALSVAEILRQEAPFRFDHYVQPFASFVLDQHSPVGVQTFKVVGHETSRCHVGITRVQLLHVMTVGSSGGSRAHMRPGVRHNAV